METFIKHLNKFKKVTYKDPIKQQALGLFKKYKRSAKSNKHSFSLTFQQFLKLTSSACAYCGIPASKIYKNHLKSKSASYLYNGIDRMDSNGGYTLGNSATCCEDCNFFKSNRNAEEFVLKCQRIARYNSFDESNVDETVD